MYLQHEGASSSQERGLTQNFVALACMYLATIYPGEAIRAFELHSHVGRRIRAYDRRVNVDDKS